MKEIISVEVVGICSLCREETSEILKDKHGRIYDDDEISCVCCGIGCSHKSEDKSK